MFESTEAHALRGKIVEVKRAEPKEATAARNALAAQQTASGAALLVAPPMMTVPAVQPPYVHVMPPLPPLPMGYLQHDGSTLLIHPPSTGSHHHKHAKDKSDNASHPNKAKPKKEGTAEKPPGLDSSSPPSSSSSSSPETNYDVDEGLAHAYGALSLQESMPVPGLPGAAMPYGYTHGGHYDAAQGAYVMTQHGLFVPQVRAPSVCFLTCTHFHVHLKSFSSTLWTFLSLRHLFKSFVLSFFLPSTPPLIRSLFRSTHTHSLSLCP